MAEHHCAVTGPELLHLARGSMPLPSTPDTFYPKCLSSKQRTLSMGLLYSPQPGGLLSFPVLGKAELLTPSRLGSPSPLHSFTAHCLLAPKGYRAISYFAGRLSYSSHASSSGPCDLYTKRRAGFTAQLLVVWKGADFKQQNCTLK